MSAVVVLLMVLFVCWIFSGSMFRHHPFSVDGVWGWGDSKLLSLPSKYWNQFYSELSSSDSTFRAENIDLSEATNKCAALITNLKDEIHERINKSSFKLGFISSGSNKKFQDFGFRQNEDDGLLIDFDTTSSNWALKIRGIKFNDSKSDDIQLDESYISYTTNNKIFSIGRMSRWWSSSWDNSLIYSNNARPSPGISFGNNLATKLDIPFLID